MNTKSLLIFFFLYFSLTAVIFGQNVKGKDKLILVHRTKPHKQKVLKLKRFYFIHTSESKKDYVYTKIAGFTDSTLSFVTMVNTGRDTVYSETYIVAKTRDTTVIHRDSVFQKQWVVIPFSDIRLIRRYWFKDNEWIKPFVWFSVGWVLAPVIIPVIALTEGKRAF